MDLTREDLRDVIAEAISKTKKVEKLTWTIDECAKNSGIGEAKLRELVAKIDTDFPFIKVGKKTLIPTDLFKMWLNEKAKNGLPI